MTTTKALAKLFKKIVGSETKKNSTTKIVNDLADNWKLPNLPTVPGFYQLKVAVIEDTGELRYTWSLEMAKIDAR